MSNAATDAERDPHVCGVSLANYDLPFVFGMCPPARLASNQLSRMMSYPAALYMPPPSVAMLPSKTQLVVFAGPDTAGSFLLHADPVENSANPDLRVNIQTD